MAEKPVMVVGLDESEHSFYALEWSLNHFFVPFASNPPFKLLIVHARPLPSSVIALVGPATGEVLPLVESDLKKIAHRIAEKAKKICTSKSVTDFKVELIDGDARKVMCDVVEKHHASMLVVGSHGYGAFKRAVLGSVSDHCAHHAHCSVLIVKKPKIRH
ncbi:UspA [Dillenia turbinata]|uniref:UspA n=1 Tax=Dillenia turbinata TaxID=194707 RepID=A0AAN8UPN3_9MAGN